MKKTKNTCLDENISIIILRIILLRLVLLAGTMNEKIVEGNNPNPVIGVNYGKYTCKLVLKNDTAGYIK